MFTIALTGHHWIGGGAGDARDLCLHGDVAASIGGEEIQASCTVSATALYLLKTLTENHVMHADIQMLPCCGRFYIPNEANDAVDILGCPNGVDWTVLHREDSVEIATEQGAKALVDKRAYRDVVLGFADSVQRVYETSPPKAVPEDDFDKRGYIAFWNEWTRRRGDRDDHFFCPAASKALDLGACWECCFAGRGGPADAANRLKNWIADTRVYRDTGELHTVCALCAHCQWPR